MQGFEIGLLLPAMVSKPQILDAYEIKIVLIHKSKVIDNCTNFLEDIEQNELFITPNSDELKFTGYQYIKAILSILRTFF